MTAAEIFGSDVDRVDVVIGGPNCQGVSPAGLHNPRDGRNVRFEHFRSLIQQLQPTWFVMENVPGLTQANNILLLQAIMEEFRDIGYETAADFGDRSYGTGCSRSVREPVRRSVSPSRLIDRPVLCLVQKPSMRSRYIGRSRMPSASGRLSRRRRGPSWT